MNEGHVTHATHSEPTAHEGMHATAALTAEQAKEVAAASEAKLTITGKNVDKIAHLIATNLVLPKDYNITFRKDKETGFKPEPFKLVLPIMTADGLLEALADKKQLEYVLSIVESEIYKAARWQVDDSANPVKGQDDLDVSKLTLDFLANMPSAERTGGGIGKEIWDEFSKDYVAVMPGLSEGKTLDKIQNAAAIFLKKFQGYKTNKPVLGFLRSQLALWFQNTPNAEEFAECYKFLDEKADTLLKADEAELLSNL